MEPKFKKSQLNIKTWWAKCPACDESYIIDGPFTPSTCPYCGTVRPASKE